ncbi:MAG: hypothetical protein Q9218_000378 [Villophora microphyllina]
MYPRPQNLAESRQVLRVLQQYGEVVMYRHLKYESPTPTLNAALAIYRTQTSAHNVINASPIRFHLQHGDNGWTSKISQDASLEGVNLKKSNGNEERENEDADGTPQEGSTSDLAEINRLPREDLQMHDISDQDEAAGLDGRALIGPDEKWGSKYFETNEKGYRSSGKLSHAPTETFSQSFDPPKASNDSIKKHNKKSAHKIAEELTTHAQASLTPQKEETTMSPTPAKEFELIVAQSLFNHQAYIERQGYYSGFNPDMKTIMAADLQGRVPLEGFVDCRLSKANVPLRQRLLKKERARPWQTLREMWENGRRARGEI